MSKGKKGARVVSGDKKNVAFRWWSDWTVVWIIGGFSLAYFAFILLESHPLHWLFSVLGGVVGYGIDTGLPPVVRFVRHRSMRITLKRDKENKQKGEGR